eukprot:2728547-Pleurochrysis_carterae.AAC.1
MSSTGTNPQEEMPHAAPAPPPASLAVPGPHTNIPAIVHLLHPDAPAAQWAAMHPAHIIYVWTREEIDVCAKLVPEFTRITSTDDSGEPALLDALLLLYLFGGTAVCHAREPKRNVLSLLLSYPTSVVILTSPPDGARLDTDTGIIAATARIKAFRALFALLEANSSAPNSETPDVARTPHENAVKEFFAASMQASKGDTIRVVSTE